jgi:hypothetical protein
MRHRRGFATTIALLMLGVVAAAIVALTALLSMDAKSTTREAEAAQLRQLLVVGAADVKAKINRGNELPEQWTIDAPRELGGQVHIELKRSGDAIQAVSAARTATCRGSQTIHLRRSGDRWEVAAVELDD